MTIQFIAHYSAALVHNGLKGCAVECEILESNEFTTKARIKDKECVFNNKFITCLELSN